jgi:hypothetical protein
LVVCHSKAKLRGPFIFQQVHNFGGDTGRMTWRRGNLLRDVRMDILEIEKRCYVA